MPVTHEASHAPAFGQLTHRLHVARLQRKEGLQLWRAQIGGLAGGVEAVVNLIAEPELGDTPPGARGPGPGASPQEGC